MVTLNRLYLSLILKALSVPVGISRYSTETVKVASSATPPSAAAVQNFPPKSVSDEEEQLQLALKLSLVIENLVRSMLHFLCISAGSMKPKSTNSKCK